MKEKGLVEIQDMRHYLRRELAWQIYKSCSNLRILAHEIHIKKAAESFIVYHASFK